MGKRNYSEKEAKRFVSQQGEVDPNNATRQGFPRGHGNATDRRDPKESNQVAKGRPKPKEEITKGETDRSREQEFERLRGKTPNEGGGGYSGEESP